jgi:hypothetical protein
MLVVMLEKHGITATMQDSEAESKGDDMSRTTQVYVEEKDYDRAHRLFYPEREDEL